MSEKDIQEQDSVPYRIELLHYSGHSRVREVMGSLHRHMVFSDDLQSGVKIPKSFQHKLWMEVQNLRFLSQTSQLQRRWEILLLLKSLCSSPAEVSAHIRCVLKSMDLDMHFPDDLEFRDLPDWGYWDSVTLCLKISLPRSRSDIFQPPE